MTSRTSMTTRMSTDRLFHKHWHVLTFCPAVPHNVAT